MTPTTKLILISLLITLIAIVTAITLLSIKNEKILGWMGITGWIVVWWTVIKGVQIYWRAKKRKKRGIMD